MKILVDSAFQLINYTNNKPVTAVDSSYCMYKFFIF